MKNFGGFRILSGDFLKNFMNKVQIIYGVFEKINPRDIREIIYKNYIITKAQDRWHLRRSPHFTMHKIENRSTLNRVKVGGRRPKNVCLADVTHTQRRR